MTEFINPNANPRTSLIFLIKTTSKNSHLIIEMIRREVVGRYKGSVFGLTWSFFNPILMLIIYTFVFSVVFNARWGVEASGSKSEFALILFAGLIIFNLFSETISRAPSLILSNVNYVKKVVFPLEILPIVSFGASLFHAVISLTVLLVAFFLLCGYVNWTAIFIPIILFPLSLFVLGVSWFLSSLGVFLRDVGQTIGVLMTIMMFLSPVFYPITALPNDFQFWMLLNPLTFIIGQAREVLIFGNLPDWYGLGIYLFISIFIMAVGFSWFQKTRKGFSDVL